MDGANKRVLIFEDNPSLQAIMRVYFQRRNFEAVVLGDAVDAVKAAADHGPALIVMDLIMPGKSGIEACDDLRKAGVRTPIIMLTSKDYADDKRRALEAGANAYLTKPLNPRELDAAIAPLLGA